MQRGFAHIFVLVGGLVLLIVLGGVYYFSKVKPGNNFSQTPVNSPVASAQNPERPAPRNEGSLQIPKITTVQQPQFNEYLNKDFGIGFDYSKELNVNADSEEEFNKRNNGDNRKNFKGYVGYEPGIVLGAVAVLDQKNDFDKSPFAIWVFNNINNLTIGQWFDKYWYYPFLWGVFDYTSKGHVAPDSEATISGQMAKYKIVSYQPGSPKYLYLSNNSKMYLFRIIGQPGDQILSTFKFLDQTSAEGKVCGGFGGEKGQFACPTGYKCKYPEPMYPDAQGQCVKSE